MPIQLYLTLLVVAAVPSLLLAGFLLHEYWDWSSIKKMLTWRNTYSRGQAKREKSND